MNKYTLPSFHRNNHTHSDFFFILEDIKIAFCPATLDSSIDLSTCSVFAKSKTFYTDSLDNPETLKHLIIV